MYSRTLATLSFALLLPFAVSAQSFSGLGNTDSFSVSVTPQYPAPDSLVTLSFLSSSLTLTSATMTIIANGKQIYKGSVQPVAVILGKTGSTTLVKVTILSAGTAHSQSLVLQPQDVSLIAEPLSSAPALYPGKPLVPIEGSTRVVAVANIVDARGRILDPGTLVYTWTVEGAGIANSSGIGKSSLTVASPLQYRERAVSVVVQSQDGSLTGRASLTLSPSNPTVRIYENDPLLGIRFDHALSGSYSIAGAESSLYAAPFSLPLLNGNPFIQWFLNGAVAQTGTVITLRPAGNGLGNASLSLTASRDASSLATANLSLSFGATSSTNLFGL